MFTFGRDKERITAGSLFRYAMAVALTVCGMIMYIYPSIRATSMMYEYAIESKRQADLKERNKTLKAKLQSRRSLELIEASAVSALGMVSPAPGQVVIVAKK